MTLRPPHIGTLREKPLHASLKQWCAEEGDRFEVRVDRYVVDVVRAGLLIEIQTGGFSSIRKKLRRLLELGHRVRVLFPTPAEKTIVRVGPEGEILGRRRSPRHGTVLDVFAELVSIPDLLADPGFEVTVVVTTEDEYRRHDPGRAWRRRGWVVLERRLTGVVAVRHLAGPSALADLLPDGLPDPFTTADVARLAGCPRRLAQQMTYCLRRLDVVTAAGKRGNAIEYRVTSGADRA
jgi:hypothetical protein